MNFGQRPPRAKPPVRVPGRWVPPAASHLYPHFVKTEWGKENNYKQSREAEMKNLRWVAKMLKSGKSNYFILVILLHIVRQKILDIHFNVWYTSLQKGGK